MLVNDYVRVQRTNLENAFRFELFASMIPLLDGLYRLSIQIVPGTSSPIFWQLLLTCHKSLLSAATLIGQAQPEDSGPVTRRAIEAARLAAAVREDPGVLETWYSYEKRQERWEARDRGETPRKLSIRIPVTHKLVKELMSTYGILSDGDVHFTPEHFDYFKLDDKKDKIELGYFTGGQEEIVTALIQLIGVHILILKIFDYCYDQRFLTDSNWLSLFQSIHAAARPWADKFKGAQV